MHWVTEGAREIGCFTVITGTPGTAGVADCCKCGAALSRASAPGVTSSHPTAIAHFPGTTSSAQAKMAIASSCASALCASPIGPPTVASQYQIFPRSTNNAVARSFPGGFCSLELVRLQRRSRRRSGRGMSCDRCSIRACARRTASPPVDTSTPSVHDLGLRTTVGRCRAFWPSPTAARAGRSNSQPAGLRRAPCNSTRCRRGWWARRRRPA